jgi:hypothetical protein
MSARSTSYSACTQELYTHHQHVTDIKLLNSLMKGLAEDLWDMSRSGIVHYVTIDNDCGQKQ